MEEKPPSNFEENSEEDIYSNLGIFATPSPLKKRKRENKESQILEQKEKKEENDVQISVEIPLVKGRSSNKREEEDLREENEKLKKFVCPLHSFLPF